MKTGKYKEESSAASKTINLAENPTKGGIPARLKTANKLVNPIRGLVFDKATRSARVLGLPKFTELVKQK